MKMASAIIICGQLVSSAIALACTQDEFIKKSQDVQVSMMEYIKKNPTKKEEVMARATEKMQEVSAKFASTKNFDEACKAYDELKDSFK